MFFCIWVVFFQKSGRFFRNNGSVFCISVVFFSEIFPGSVYPLSILNLCGALAYIRISTKPKITRIECSSFGNINSIWGSKYCDEIVAKILKMNNFCENTDGTYLQVACVIQEQTFRLVCVTKIDCRLGLCDPAPRITSIKHMFLQAQKNLQQ